MLFDEHNIWAASQSADQVGAEALDPESLVVPDGLVDMSETHQMARQLVEVFRSADFDNPTAGQCEVIMHSVNLVFPDDEFGDCDRVVGYLVVINRFLGEFLWSMNVESRDLYFEHLTEMVDEWSNMVPTAWFDTDPSPLDTEED
jgi:hypothetical protein